MLFHGYSCTFGKKAQNIGKSPKNQGFRGCWTVPPFQEHPVCYCPQFKWEVLDQCPCVCILKARSPMAKGLLKLRTGVTNWEFRKIWGENVVSFGRYSISRWFGLTEMTPESFLSEKHRNCYNTTDDFEFLFKVNETWWILHILWLSLGWKSTIVIAPLFITKLQSLTIFRFVIFAVPRWTGGHICSAANGKIKLTKYLSVCLELWFRGNPQFWWI